MTVPPARCYYLASFDFPAKFHEVSPCSDSECLNSLSYWSLSSSSSGPVKLPEIGSGIGKGIRNFKEATKKDEEPKSLEDDKNKEA